MSLNISPPASLRLLLAGAFVLMLAACQSTPAATAAKETADCQAAGGYMTPSGCAGQTVPGAPPLPNDPPPPTSCRPEAGPLCSSF
jgi:hypothetical protein